MVIENISAACIEQYLRKLSGQEKMEILDHNYSKHFTAHPGSSKTKPAVMLFMNLNRWSNNSDNRDDVDTDEEIDVTTDPVEIFTPFDSEKAKSELHMHAELEELVHNKCAGRELSNEEWENSSYCVKRMYLDVQSVLDAFFLAQLTYSGRPNEVVKLKIFLSKCSTDLLRVFVKYNMQPELLQLLHTFILSSCSEQICVTYLKFLQELCSHPAIFESIRRTFPLSNQCGPFQCDHLFQLLKKKDCSSLLPILNHYKLRKLPGNPIIVFVTPPIRSSDREAPHRFTGWLNSMGSICKTIVSTPENVESKSYTAALDDTMSNVRTKVVSLLNRFPQRPVILAGYNVGSLIACHVALETQVAAVLCFGFILTGVNGSRSVLNDPLVDNKVPVLFIVGENSNSCSIDDIEDFRARMRAETSLVVVGGADADLYVAPEKMLHENLSLEIVDRCIMDEVVEFINFTVMSKQQSVIAKYSMSSYPTILERKSREKQSTKRKRGKQREMSPPVPKRRRLVAKAQCISKKPHQSSSGSEASSSGSVKNAKRIDSKKGKVVLRISKGQVSSNFVKTKRSSVKANIKLTAKDIQDITVKCTEESSDKKDIEEAKDTKSPSSAESTVTKEPSYFGNPIEECESESPNPIFPVKKAEVKSKLPFALHILPKKNDPVDVAKAFGKDKSFLPQPLTSPEPEDTASADETEKESVIEKPCVTSSESFSVLNSEPLVSIPLSCEKISVTSDVPTTILNTEKSPASILKPVFCTSVDAKKKLSISGFKTVFHQGSISKHGITHSKVPPSISLIPSKTNPLNPQKATITIPSRSTLLVPSKEVKTQTSKVIKLLPKTALVLGSKDTEGLPFKIGGTVEQASNLSLLSDIAGMKEPLKDAFKTLGTVTSPATLVKLAVPKKPQICPSNPNQILQSFQSHPQRIETPEELKEKQIAIQSLRNIGIESSKESGYSICYTKTDGSVVSHPVKKSYVPQVRLAHPSSKLPAFSPCKLNRKN